MKIAHVVSTFPPYRGGTGSVCYYNALYVARLGHDVTVITQAADANAASGDDADAFKVVRLRPRLRVGNAPILAGLASALAGFDLVHLHYPFYGGAEVVWRIRHRVPYVVTYHQDVLLPGLLGAVVKLHHAAIGARILRDSSRLIVTTSDYAHASRIGALMRSGTAVEVVPNGVDCSRFERRDGRKVRDRYGLRSKTALFVGGLDRAHYFKGIDVLLNALALPGATDIQALIVGEGDLRPKYERVAAERGLRDRVIFAGSVPDADLPDYYAAAEFLVLPSINGGEAFGVVQLEAFATGIPVIVSNLPGVRAVAGDEGILCAPGSADDLARAIGELAHDDARRREMGRRAHARARQEFDWSVIAPKLVEIYSGVTPSRR